MIHNTITWILTRMLLCKHHGITARDSTCSLSSLPPSLPQSMCVCVCAKHIHTHVRTCIHTHAYTYTFTFTHLHARAISVFLSASLLALSHVHPRALTKTLMDMPVLLGPHLIVKVADVHQCIMACAAVLVDCRPRLERLFGMRPNVERVLRCRPHCHQQRAASRRQSPLLGPH